ncbi:hypothetical protein GGI00_007069, partial [Coemansia sp. RSA 2681]
SRPPCLLPTTRTRRSRSSARPCTPASPPLTRRRPARSPACSWRWTTASCSTCSRRPRLSRRRSTRPSRCSTRLVLRMPRMP